MKYRLRCIQVVGCNCSKGLPLLHVCLKIRDDQILQQQQDPRSTTDV